MTRAMCCVQMSRGSLLIHFKGISFFEQNIRYSGLTLTFVQLMSQLSEGPLKAFSPSARLNLFMGFSRLK